MTDRPIPDHDNAGRRRFIDRLTRRAVTACGVVILLVMMLLFFWLIWVVVTLFVTPPRSTPGTKSNCSSISLRLRWGWTGSSSGAGTSSAARLNCPTR